MCRFLSAISSVFTSQKTGAEPSVEICSVLSGRLVDDACILSWCRCGWRRKGKIHPVNSSSLIDIVLTYSRLFPELHLFDHCTSSFGR